MSMNLDPRILELLKRRRQEQAPPNQLYATLADSAAKMGTIGGQASDASSVQKWASGADRSNEIMQKQDDQRQAKLAQYLAQVRGKQQDRTMKLADVKSDRDYKENRYNIEQKDTQKNWEMKQEYIAQNKEKDRESALEDYKEKTTYDAEKKAGVAKEKLNLSSKRKPYEQQVASLSSEKLKRFDSSSMGLSATMEMQRALKQGSNTFSIMGDNAYTMARAKFKEALGRMQSGGAITSDEEKSFLQMAPEFLDGSEIQREKMVKILGIMAMRVENLGFDPDEVMSKQSEIEDRYRKHDWSKPETNTAIAGEDSFKAGDIEEKGDGSRWEYQGNDIWKELK